MGKVAGLQTLPSSKFSHTNLLSISQLQTDAKVDMLIWRTWNFACLRSCYALSDYGTQKLIRDNFLVTWLILGHVTHCCKRPILRLPGKLWSQELLCNVGRSVEPCVTLMLSSTNRNAHFHAGLKMQTKLCWEQDSDNRRVCYSATQEVARQR